MAGIKIVDLPSLGRDLASTDLFEMSLVGGTGSRKITGQEIMNASKLSVGNTPIVNGAVGQLLFQGAGNVLGESANLFWDNTNKRLGIGTATPSVALSIVGGAKITALVPALTLESTFWGDSTFIQNGVNIIANSTGNYFNIFNPAGKGFSYTRAAGVDFAIFPTGNVAINTETDAGFKLDVNGTARVVNATWDGTALLLQGPSPGKALHVLANSQVLFESPLTMRGSLINFYEPTGLAAATTLGEITSGGAHWSASNVTRILFAASGGTWSGSSKPTKITFSTTNVGNITATEKISIEPSGNLLIGTSTDNGFKLDVNGNTRVTNITTPLIYTTGSDTLTLATQGGTSAVTVFPTTRNVLIQNGGTPVDAGYRLDVNGTARVKDAGSELAITSPLSAVAPIIFTTKGAGGGYRGGYNFKGGYGGTAGNTIFIIDTGNTDAGSRGGFGNFLFSDLAAAKFTIDNTQSGGRNAALRLRGNFANNFTEYNGIDFNAYTGTDIGGFIGSQRNSASSGFGADIVVLATLDSAPSTYLEVARFIGRYNSFYVGTDKTLAVASAKMQVESTTQGFLPPRMTQAQRNAIASPAIGLEIYQTDATEGKYIYKSSGWTYIG